MLIVTALGACAGAATSTGTEAPATAAGAVATSRPPGFAPVGQTLFAPVVQLAPPGPARAARAVAILDRQLAFQRKIFFHPEIDTALERVIAEMPPRQSTVIRAAALYARRSIPWSVRPDGTHQISVVGAPRPADYFYELTNHYRSPETAERFSGRFALQPADGSAAPAPSSVIGTLGGELLLDTLDLGALVDVVAAALAECYGDLRPPWDTAPGAFNQHDHAILDRLHRDMPHVATKLHAYLQFHNLLDEFQSPAGPVVLLNLDVEARLDALQKYPRFAAFYRTLAAAVTMQSTVLDADGNEWLRTAFDHGHIRISLMVRDGRLTPFSTSLQPVGEGVRLNAIDHGRYRTLAAVRVTGFYLDFGLANLGFTTTYQRDREAVVFESRMNTVPELVAPPGIRQAIDLIAGTFLHALATGHGGLAVHLTSRRVPSGMYQFAGSAGAELVYAPALALLARIGDALAGKHNADVRAEERALGEEFFDAFVADYTDTRAAILALDGGQEP
ncbi:MAG TPA: hypothetical protein VMW56_25425 [Candidatus Margulisiibacteriota bacterium]|nr:hypothetical protein [Candidatus Margulisiibacteriota bacterium]